MATRFIYTGKDYVNLDTVQVAKSKDDGRHQIVVGGKVIDDHNLEFLTTLVSVIPVQGEWECLLRAETPDSFTCEPVIAWGVTVLGKVVPITPGEPGGVEGECGLRMMGRPRVYSPNNMGGYADDKEWLKLISEHDE